MRCEKRKARELLADTPRVIAATETTEGTHYEVSFPEIDLSGRRLRNFITASIGRSEPRDSIRGIHLDLDLPIRAQYGQPRWGSSGKYYKQLIQLHQRIPGWQDYVQNHNDSFYACIRRHEERVTELREMTIKQFQNPQEALEHAPRKKATVRSRMRRFYRRNTWFQASKSNELNMQRLLDHGTDEELTRLANFLWTDQPGVYVLGNTPVVTRQPYSVGFRATLDTSVLHVFQDISPLMYHSGIPLRPSPFGPQGLYDLTSGERFIDPGTGMTPVISWTRTPEGRTYDLGPRDGGQNTLLGLLAIGILDPEIGQQYPEEMTVKGRVQNMTEAQAPMFYHLNARRIMSQAAETFEGLERRLH